MAQFSFKIPLLLLPYITFNIANRRADLQIACQTRSGIGGATGIDPNNAHHPAKTRDF
jgi:hypothetical protein